MIRIRRINPDGIFKNQGKYFYSFFDQPVIGEFNVIKGIYGKRHIIIDIAKQNNPLFELEIFFHECIHLLIWTLSGCPEVSRNFKWHERWDLLYKKFSHLIRIFSRAKQ